MHRAEKAANQGNQKRQSQGWCKCQGNGNSLLSTDEIALQVL